VPDWSWSAWTLSVVFVIASGLCAWWEGNWWRREDLDIGFASHGGMWSDLLVLPIVNAVIVPWLRFETWLAAPALAGMALSWWLHAHWHRGGGEHYWREHMWPARHHERWERNLSWAGWLHVLYVAAEIGLLVAYAFTPVPSSVVLIVSALLTVHVPIGLFAPAWVATRGRLVRNRLLAPALAAIWIVALVKL
jgi:hypothetical protein